MAFDPQPDGRLAKWSHAWLLVLCLQLLYALLLIPTLDRLGIGWDEAVDLRIARAYLSPRGLVLGLPLDPSQTRLPTFSVALVYRLLGTDNLLVARWASVLVGGLTVFGTYLYGRDRFGRQVGLLAAGFLALNPFFLAFARLAFTESDVYLACALIWLLLAVSRLQVQPRVGHAAGAGLALGLAISAKATALLILPAVWMALYLSRPTAAHAIGPEPAAKFVPTRLLWLCAGWAACVLLAGLYGSWRLQVSAAPGVLRLLLYGLVSLGWLLPMAWAIRRRHYVAHPHALAALVTGLGLLTFVIFPPDHLTNTGIVRSLFERAESEMSLNPTFMAELAALHLLAVFFKSTPGLGLGLLAGTLIALSQWRRIEVRLPLMVAASYFASLLFLPLGQTFYMVPLLPVLSLLAADQFVRLRSQHRQVALAVALVAISGWGLEMVQCYPDYHLNGYQWVGQRVLFGRSSIGYRSVVFTPADGVEQAMEWLNTNAKPGQVAQLYVGPWHIVRSMAPEPAYTLVNGYEVTRRSRPDFVVLHINELFWQGEGPDPMVGDVGHDPFDPSILMSEYERVFVVKRAYGLEMASIWQRKGN